jgi:lipopolysaccharide export system permease protein
VKTLDRYIILKYISTFFFASLIFSLIILVIDISQKVERFVLEDLTLKEIAMDYYIYFIPHINIMLWPLFALISVIFFTSRMAYNSEIISILNAGVSYNRLVRPYMITAVVLMVAHLFFNHHIIPEGSKSRIAFENTYISKNKKEHERSNNIHLFTDENTKVYVRYFRDQDSTISDIRLERFDSLKLVEMIKAKRAEWLFEEGKWRFQDYEIHTFDGLKETFEKAPGLSFDTTLNMRPDDFIRFSNQKEMMTTAEIKKYIESELSRGIANTRAFEVEIHRRTADAYTLIILTLMGMAVASRKVRGGIGLHLASGISIGAAYIVFSKFAITFAQGNVIPPLVGVWIPNMAFTAITIYLLMKAQK